VDIFRNVDYTMAILMGACKYAIKAFGGFSVTGILPNSLASKLMSLYAKFYGGHIPKGSIFSWLQSLGARGWFKYLSEKASWFLAGELDAAMWIAQCCSCSCE